MKTPPRGPGLGRASDAVDRSSRAGTSSSDTPEGTTTPENAVRQVFSLRVQAKSLQDSISPKASEAQRNAAYFAGWDAWAAVGGSEGGDRKEAVRRLKATLQSQRPEPALSLNGLDLTTLPDNLPSWLGSLDIANNRLTWLPENLPHWLGKLDVSANCLTVLPANLPAWLKELDASGNRLDELPEALPSGLTMLNVDGNRLRGFPAYLPATIEHIHASNNRLRLLSEHLPASLRELNADGNMLIALPKKLPSRMTYLNVDDNQLTCIPHNLPTALIRLVLDRNSLIALPEYVALRLKPSCTISLHGNPLSERTRSYLSAMREEPGYRGPVFQFSVQENLFTFPIRPLAESIGDWYREIEAIGGDTIVEDADKTAHEASRIRWHSFEAEDGAASFSHFLDGLRRTVSYGNASFRASVIEWLDTLSVDRDLRQKTFLVSSGATDSCQDRVSHTLNAMKLLRIEQDIERGRYDDRITELLPLARGMFRIETLDKIANQKILSLNLVDEIEVCLAYQVKLRTLLQLPIDTPDMRFFDVSYVTADDLKEAENTVKILENSEFAAYLSIWKPWQSLLARVTSADYIDSRKRFLEVLEDEFEDRLGRRLADSSLSNDEEAAIRSGPLVSREIEHEIMHALTVRMLSDRGLSSLLSSPWQASLHD